MIFVETEAFNIVDLPPRNQHHYKSVLVPVCCSKIKEKNMDRNGKMVADRCKQGRRGARGDEEVDKPGRLKTNRTMQSLGFNDDRKDCE